MGISRPPPIATGTNQRITHLQRYVVDAFRILCGIFVAPEVRFGSSIYAVLKILANIRGASPGGRAGYHMGLCNRSMYGLVCPPVSRVRLLYQNNWDYWVRFARQVRWADPQHIHVTLGLPRCAFPAHFLCRPPACAHRKSMLPADSNRPAFNANILCI